MPNIGSLVGRQQSIEQEIKRLEELRLQSGQLSSAQTKSVEQLINRQADLREEATQQADSMKTLPVFSHLLKRAGETMQNVEQQLMQTDLGPATQQAAAEASEQTSSS